MAFQTTQWSVVLAAQDSNPEKARRALEKLCADYWQPVYSYLRHLGYKSEDAKDLTQEFFARFLDKALIQKYDRERGRFRNFLLVALRSFTHDEWRQSQTLKRGGQVQIVPLDETRAEADYAATTNNHTTPDQLFERRWALTILANALEALRNEFAEDGKAAHFDALKPFLTVDLVQPKYQELAQQLGMSESALKTAVHRLRKRYGHHIRACVARTVAEESEIEDEVRHLLDVLSI